MNAAIKCICLLVGLSLLALPVKVFAHHGLANYDTREVIKIHGQVVDYRLRDPHSLLFVEVTNDDGSRTLWTIQGGSASGLARSGISRQKLASHPKVIVHAYGSRNNQCREQCEAAGLDFIFE